MNNEQGHDLTSGFIAAFGVIWGVVNYEWIKHSAGEVYFWTSIIVGMLGCLWFLHRLNRWYWIKGWRSLYNGWLYFISFFKRKKQ